MLALLMATLALVTACSGPAPNASGANDDPAVVHAAGVVRRDAPAVAPLAPAVAPELPDVSDRDRNRDRIDDAFFHPIRPTGMPLDSLGRGSMILITCVASRLCG